MPRKLTAFYLDPELAADLQRVKDRDGISIAEQIRRGIRLWLDTKALKAERSQAPTRKRS
jgi:hypothetical protein